MFVTTRLEEFQSGAYSVLMLDQATPLLPAAWAEAVRGAGLRATRQRIAVLEAVGSKPHLSAAAVLGDVARALPGVSHQAVYDCLADLTRVGLLRRIAIDGGAALFETRTDDNHHHIVCRSCRLVVDVDCATGATPCLIAADAAGFIIDEADVTYRGLCPTCAANVPTISIIASKES